MTCEDESRDYKLLSGNGEILLAERVASDA